MSRQEIDFEFKLFEFFGILGPWTEFEVSIRRLDLPFTEYDNSQPKHCSFVYRYCNL
jgi:hypothetical protein